MLQICCQRRNLRDLALLTGLLGGIDWWKFMDMVTAVEALFPRLHKLRNPGLGLLLSLGLCDCDESDG